MEALVAHDKSGQMSGAVELPMIEFDEPGVKHPLYVVLEASVADASCGVALHTIVILNCSSRLPPAQGEREEGMFGEAATGQRNKERREMSSRICSWEWIRMQQLIFLCWWACERPINRMPAC
jgi:hypothetical protein